ncbi:hypothetical protein [Streptomyces albidochromogenes]|uniref:hypothetical protein n=1 Tax=Streptomyces albidochromogenes TaxID=329524 RepID=UPI001FCC9494|nr:hypothetical protein [Streptomyces albidochromogenes]
MRRQVELAAPVLEITVWDTNPALPVVFAPDAGRIGGHGLEIITAMCEGVEARRKQISPRPSRTRHQLVSVLL